MGYSTKGIAILGMMVLCSAVSARAGHSAYVVPVADVCVGGNVFSVSFLSSGSLLICSERGLSSTDPFAGSLHAEKVEWAVRGMPMIEVLRGQYLINVLSEDRVAIWQPGTNGEGKVAIGSFNGADFVSRAETEVDGPIGALVEGRDGVLYGLDDRALWEFAGGSARKMSGLRSMPSSPTFPSLRPIAVSASSNQLAVGEEGGSVALYQLPGQKRVSVTRSGFVSCLAFSEDKSILLVGTSVNKRPAIDLYAVPSLKRVDRILCKTYVSDICVVPRRGIVVCGGYMIEVKSGRVLHCFDSPAEQGCCAVNEERRLIATGHANGVVRIWRY